MLLRPQQKAQIAARPRVVPQSVPAPYTGWNTRDALDEMSPTDAVLLDNWYPDASGVNLRNGYIPFATNAGSMPVKTLAQFSAGPILKFLAASSGTIYDITAGGSAPIPLGTGYASDAWQYANFLSKMFLVNGVDAALIYDGAVLAAANFDGVDTTTLIGVALYQQRLFFWQNSSAGFWYAPLNSISGTLVFYDLSVFSPRGGNLIAVTTTTHDGGNGVFDFITFILSSGDCIHFLGNDPSQATAWQLIGIYRISPPVSPRAVCQYGAESFLTTSDDHVPLQQQLVALKVGALPPRSRVSTAVQQAVIANRNGFGWQALYYPAGRRLIFNIPNPDGTFSQHICNTAIPSQPWSRFMGMQSYCWGLFNNSLYFGSDNGVVYQADIGNFDNGQPISGTAQQAWNTFDAPIRKAMKACRPIFQPVGALSFDFTIGFDYGPTRELIVGTTATSGSPWNTSPWNTSPWSAPIQIDTRWRIGGGSGQAIGFALAVATPDAVTWLRTDFRYEPGSAL